MNSGDDGPTVTQYANDDEVLAGIDLSSPDIGRTIWRVSACGFSRSS